MDVHDAETRSKNMAAIKGRNMKPELIIRKPCIVLDFVIASMPKTF